MNCNLPNLTIANIVYVKPRTNSIGPVSYFPNLKVHQLIFEVSGRYDTFLGGSKITATPNSVRFYPKGNYNSYVVNLEKNTECIDVCFESDSPITDFPVILSENVPNLAKPFKQMFFSWSKKEPGYYNECLSLLYKVLSELEKSKYLPEKQFSKIKPAVDYINQNFLLKKIATEDLLSLCSISYSHLKNTFKRKYGLSPQKYVTMLKMNYACSLLEVGAYNVTQIAEMCGFDDMNFFSRKFKDFFGVSPTQYAGEKLKTEKN